MDLYYWNIFVTILSPLSADQEGGTLGCFCYEAMLTVCLPLDQYLIHIFWNFWYHVLTKPKHSSFHRKKQNLTSIEDDNHAWSHAVRARCHRKVPRPRQAWHLPRDYSRGNKDEFQVTIKLQVLLHMWPSFCHEPNKDHPVSICSIFSVHHNTQYLDHFSNLKTYVIYTSYSSHVLYVQHFHYDCMRAMARAFH